MVTTCQSAGVAAPPRDVDHMGHVVDNPLRASLTKTTSIAAVEAEADRQAKELALGDINWKLELAEKVVLSGFECEKTCGGCSPWCLLFVCLGYTLGCVVAGEFGWGPAQFDGLFYGCFLGIMGFMLSFRAGHFFLYLIPVVTSTGVQLVLLGKAVGLEEETQIGGRAGASQLQVGEVTAVTSIHCTNDTGICNDVTTHYAACQNGHCLELGLLMLFAIVIEQLAAHLTVRYLKKMHASLSQLCGRQGVVWTRKAEDGNETIVNVWQQCQTDEERRNQRLYLAFQNRLRQQGRLDGRAIELDLESEYDVQAFFEEAKVKLEAEFDTLEQRSKGLLVTVLICLGIRATIAIIMCCQEMLEFADCEQALWFPYNSTDPVRQVVELSWSETLPKLTIAGSAGPDHDEEGIYCLVDGGAGCTPWYSGTQQEKSDDRCTINDDEAAAGAALNDCLALLGTDCSALYGACVNCERACKSAVIEDTRSESIFLIVDWMALTLQWPCMMISPFCVLVAIPVCYRVGRQLTVKAKAQYEEQRIMEIEQLEMEKQPDGTTKWIKKHLGITGDGIQIAESDDGSSTSAVITPSGVAVQRVRWR